MTIQTPSRGSTVGLRFLLHTRPLFSNGRSNYRDIVRRTVVNTENLFLTSTLSRPCAGSNLPRISVVCITTILYFSQELLHSISRLVLSAYTVSSRWNESTLDSVAGGRSAYSILGCRLVWNSWINLIGYPAGLIPELTIPLIMVLWRPPRARKSTNDPATSPLSALPDHVQRQAYVRGSDRYARDGERE